MIIQNNSAEYSDYMHINVAVIGPEDDNILISYRNSNTILKLDRDTEENMWKLGGKDDEFGLTEKQKFSKQQHLMLLSDGTIMWFNNCNVLTKAAYPKVPKDSPLRDKKEVLFR